MKVMVIEIKTYQLMNIQIKLKDNKIDFKKYDTWKIQLRITINFISSKATNEECIVYSKKR